MTFESTAARFVTRQPPQFANVADERRHRLERLAGVCRVFGRLGFSEGLLGHITVRDPEFPDLFWVNPVGVSFRRLKVSDLIQVDHDGNVLVGDLPANPVGLLLHSAVHEARPEVTAMCHAHSLYGKAWSSLGRVLDPITQDSCVLFERQALIREPRVALERSAATQFAAAFGQHLTAIHLGHGLFTTGHTVDEAAWWFIVMEQACQAQFLAEGSGPVERWPDDIARGLAGSLGTPEFGWLSFQTLWDEIIQTDPDLFN